MVIQRFLGEPDVMGSYSVAQAKTQLSGLLSAVEAGENVIITRRGIAIASLTPIAKPKPKVDWVRIKNLQGRSAKAFIKSELDLTALVQEMRGE
jgi:prevent-host-death family protein